MTAAAVANNADVIEIRGHPAGCRMTVIAGVTAGHMRWRLARGNHSVVTRPTGANNLCMIDSHSRYKPNDTMAIFANRGGLNMCCVLAGRVRTVVAACTISRNVDVVEVRWNPARGRVTIVTGIATRNMRRRFAGRNIAVVTGLAGTNDLCMVHHDRWCPKIHAMAIFTHKCGLYVSEILAGRIRTVMAVGTIAGDAGVIKICWRPADGRMAVIAIITTGEMSGMLAGRSNAIVTGSATAEHLCVIHRVRWQPRHRVMAVFANIRRLNVCWILAGRIRSVVTAGTVATDVDVVEIGRNPARSCVTVVAIITTDNVVGIFAGSDNAVVAGAATTQHRTVIDRKCRCKGICCMTILARVDRQDVGRILADRVDTVMAGDAVAGDVRMIKNSRRPCRGVVAVIALFTGCDMRRRLAGGLHTVVTGVATTDYCRVVHKYNRAPCSSDMAVGALPG